MEFKRNQVVEAISGLMEPRSLKPSSELRTRVKRLLETDRALGGVRGSVDPESSHYAFFSAVSPGTGVEVWFSEYEAFALLVGLLLMKHGWPQSLVVTVLRQVRRELEKQHCRILVQDPKKLFDQEEIRRNARPGDFVFDNTDPVLLVIISKSGPSSNEENELYACAVCRGVAEATALGSQRASATVLTLFEVVNVAYQLSQLLSATKPLSRGRGR